MRKVDERLDELTTGPGIPWRLTPCFQEYDLEQLYPEAHSDLIIERTLAYGDRHAARWLWQRYGQARLRAWVQRAGARRLPWRRYTLWCVLLVPFIRAVKSSGYGIIRPHPLSHVDFDTARVYTGPGGVGKRARRTLTQQFFIAVRSVFHREG